MSNFMEYNIPIVDCREKVTVEFKSLPNGNLFIADDGCSVCMKLLPNLFIQYPENINAVSLSSGMLLCISNNSVVMPIYATINILENATPYTLEMKNSLRNAAKKEITNGND